MDTLTKLIVLGLSLAVVSGLAKAAEPSPAEESPPAARASYASAFEGYRPLIDEPMRPWRDANDEMDRLGGHTGHIGSDARTPARPAPGNAGTPAHPASGSANEVTPGAHPSHQR